MNLEGVYDGQHAAFNRTIVELKCYRKQHPPASRPPFNRTIVELKSSKLLLFRLANFF